MGKRRIFNASLASVGLAAGMLFAAPPVAAHADWGGCYSWDADGGYGYGRCNNVVRAWRVWVVCKFQSDQHSEWIRQNGGDVTTRTSDNCDFGVRSTWIEEKPLW